MHVASVRASLVVVLLLAAMAPAVWRPLPAAAQDDAARFAEMVAARESLTSLAGPLSGELTQQQGYSSLEAAGISVDSFSATATFVNPTQPGDAPWDVGFVFGTTPETSQQVVIDSTGVWSSGRNDGDSALARSAEQSAKAARDADEARRASGA